MTIGGDNFDPVGTGNSDPHLDRPGDLSLLEDPPPGYLFGGSFFPENGNADGVDGDSVRRGQHDVGARDLALVRPLIDEALDSVHHHQCRPVGKVDFGNHVPLVV